MPRNGSGTYSLPEAPFVPGTTISSAAVNNDYSDIALALTASISADGQTAITGPLKAAAGSAAAPAWTFTADNTSGMYLSAAGVLGLTAGGEFGLLLNSVAFAAASAVVVAGGNGYVVGDTITTTGGTATRQAVFQVATLSGSAVATVTLVDGGLFSVEPSNPVAQGSTSGGGTGCTLTVTWGNADLISDANGAAAWPLLGASAYMSGLMTTVSAAALNTALRGTDLTPTAITLSQNNYAPAGFAAAATLRLSSTGAVNITGISNAGIIDQQQLTLVNIGSNTITLTANDASSTAGNLFLVGRPVTLKPSAAVRIQYDATASGWRVSNLLQANPPATAFKNLSIKVATNTTVAVAADDVVLTDGTYSLNSGVVSATLDLGSSGAVNKLDTGSIAVDTFYYVYVISNGVTMGTLGSTSSTSPTMPAGYTFKARVGTVKTIHGSATLYGTWQLGKKVQYVVGLAQTAAIPPLLTGASGTVGTPASWTAVALGTYVSATQVGPVPPTAASVRIIMFGSFAAGSGNTAIAAPNNSYGIYSSTTNPPPLSLNGGGAAVNQTVTGEFLIESANIYYASSISGAGIFCLGWDENL